MPETAFPAALAHGLKNTPKNSDSTTAVEHLNHE
jgi:hypothetical protein